MSAALRGPLADHVHVVQPRLHNLSDCHANVTPYLLEVQPTKHLIPEGDVARREVAIIALHRVCFVVDIITKPEVDRG